MSRLSEALAGVTDQHDRAAAVLALYKQIYAEVAAVRMCPGAAVKRVLVAAGFAPGDAELLKRRGYGAAWEIAERESLGLRSVGG